MHPLNPFLRAFFRSTLPAQCAPVQNHILFVPTTEVLLNSKDADSNTAFVDLAGSEEFLGSHVIRLPATSVNHEAGSIRDNRSRARQFHTVNGRTVVIKDGLVYSNKGFKVLNHAQLLHDTIWFPDTNEPQPWLIYYISKPLIGSFESTLIAPEIPLLSSAPHRSTLPPRFKSKTVIQSEQKVNQSGKTIVTSFNELLNTFPMIARQMQPGLESLFKDIANRFQKPLPPAPVEEGVDKNNPEIDAGSSSNTVPNGAAVEYDETSIQLELENAVTAAIDLFQLTDKQQLSLLGAATDLTGSVVERLIERYVAEQLHDAIIFPRLQAIHKSADLELEAMIRQMESIDISQVGIPIKGGQAGKRELLLRLDKGVEEFRKLGVAGSPQQMLEVLLNTEKTVSQAVSYDSTPLLNGDDHGDNEKPSTMMTINADTLVSLLLVVVIRAHVRHLQARLTYMRRFIFTEDVESGETGYALSTFEAVLTYLATDSSGLRKASRRNKRLWHAIKTGDVLLATSILEPADDSADLPLAEKVESTTFSSGAPPQNASNGNGVLPRPSSRTSFADTDMSHDDHVEFSTLDHVFPFQAQHFTNEDPIPDIVARKGKRVALDTRSMSSSSVYSFHSRTTTIDSRTSAIENDTSIEKLTGTQDSAGHSLLMMAIEHRQPSTLKYLLSLRLYFSHTILLEDTDNDGLTLLSAAVQSADKELVNLVVDAIFEIGDANIIWDYIRRVDSKGRSVGHYLVDSPHLIPKLGHLVPWRQKDRNGQTPLFALCRAYDHSEYNNIVFAGLDAAIISQSDGQPLHADDHVDIKGNTILHVVNNALLAQRLLLECDLDVNAKNDKHFTPLMVASKYGRLDMVRSFFDDARTDIHARELRGFTAVELAKDDEIRNNIDDMILLSQAATTNVSQVISRSRVTAVVRSFFVEDATVRLVIKSGVPSSPSLYTMTTSRRSLSDFESLAKWLAVEHPDSWIPMISDFRSPFQIPSRPSRSVLRAIQARLNGFLHTLLSHPTFATHEMLWEFFLVPDMQLDMMAARSKVKVASRTEKLKEEYEPIDDIETAELFTNHARDTVRSTSIATKSVMRRINKIRNISSDLADVYHLLTLHFLPFTFLPFHHLNALSALTHAYTPPSVSPHAALHTTLLTTLSILTAVSTALTRPSALIASLQTSQRAIQKHVASARRADRWPLDLSLGLGLLDDARARMHAEAERKIVEAEESCDILGREIEASRGVVAAELAGWQAMHADNGRKAIRTFVVAMCVREKEILAGLKRAVRVLKVGEESHDQSSRAAPSMSLGAEDHPAVDNIDDRDESTGLSISQDADLGSEQSSSSS